VQGFFERGDYKTADRPARRLFTGTSTDMATAATLSLLLRGTPPHGPGLRRPHDRFGAEVIAKNEVLRPASGFSPTGY
jgi:hypothetical protein